MLVIGMGHSDRGDDAAGHVVARRLKDSAPAGVSVIETDGEAGKLIALFEQSDNVVIIDAGLSGAEPGTIHRIDANSQAMPRPMFAMSSHAIGLVESVELARALGQLPKRCIVIAIEGKNFDLGAGLSPQVAAAIDRASELALSELKAATNA